MRKIASSGKCSCRIWLSACADCAVVAERLLDHEPRVLVEAGLRERRDRRRRTGPAGSPDSAAAALRAPSACFRRCERLRDRCSRRRHSSGASAVRRRRPRRSCRDARGCPWRAPANCSSVQPALATPTIGTLTPFVAHEPLQRGKDLLVGEIAGGAEETQARRSGAAFIQVPAGFSWWPPNSSRIADISLSAYSAAPRDSKRPNSAALKTGAGTPSSIAACSVQRPSPESDTRPANLPRLGSLRKRRGGEVEQPRADHAAAPPDLGHLRDLDVVAIIVRDGAAASSPRPPPASRGRHWRGAGCSCPSA